MCKFQFSAHLTQARANFDGKWACQGSKAALEGANVIKSKHEPDIFYATASEINWSLLTIWHVTMDVDWLDEKILEGLETWEMIMLIKKAKHLSNQMFR